LKKVNFVNFKMESHLSVVPKATNLDRSSWEHLKDKLPNSLFEKNRSRFI